MKLILATVLALAFASVAAQAGYRCSQFGNQTVCSDDYGNQTHCSRFGNQVVCN
jgi:hypothetical protein